MRIQKIIYGPNFALNSTVVTNSTPPLMQQSTRLRQDINVDNRHPTPPNSQIYNPNATTTENVDKPLLDSSLTMRQFIYIINTAN